MNEPNYALQVHIYTADGGVHRFYQDQDEDVRRIISGLHPNRVFTQKQIVVAGTYFMAGFMTATVTRIDIIGDEIPPIAHTGDLREVEEITEAEMEKRCLPSLSDPKRTDMRATSDGLIEFYAEFQTVDGLRTCMRLRSRSTGRIDMRQQTHSIMNASGFHINRLKGGVIIVNPSNIARWAFYPGLPEAPANSWPLHRLDMHEDAAPSLIFQKLSQEDLMPDE